MTHREQAGSHLNPCLFSSLHLLLQVFYSGTCEICWFLVFFVLFSPPRPSKLGPNPITHRLLEEIKGTLINQNIASSQLNYWSGLLISFSCLGVNEINHRCTRGATTRQSAKRNGFTHGGHWCFSPPHLFWLFFFFWVRIGQWHYWQHEVILGSHSSCTSSPALSGWHINTCHYHLLFPPAQSQEGPNFL